MFRAERMSRGFPITAYSACNGLGSDTASVLDALFAGRSGLGPIPEDHRLVGFAGSVGGALPPMPAGLESYACRQSALALLGLSELERPVADVVRRFGAGRVGLVLATSTGAIAHSERAYAAYVRDGSLPPGFSLERQHAIVGTLDVVRTQTGIEGPAYVVSTACSSSAKVFASARRLLSAGLVDAVLVGGVDTLCDMTLRGFSSLGVLSNEPCRPFSSERKGINIGEGAAFLLLEREGSASTYLLGVGESSDAHHMTQPHPEGRGARAAMERALAMAGLSPEVVDHVNAHGTGTKQNDAGESHAIHDLLGPEARVVATKGYTGHMLGAAGASEVVFSIAAIERGQLPKSLGCDPVDAELRVRVTVEAVEHTSRYVLSNSLAFGGSNVSVLIGAAQG